MAQVETVRGPIDVTSMGTTLMHEHVFVRNEEVQRNYPGDWDEQERVDDAAEKLTIEMARRAGADKSASAGDLPKIEGKMLPQKSN